jgi:hypothetical protein
MHQAPTITRPDGTEVQPITIEMGRGTKIKQLSEPLVTPEGMIVDAPISSLEKPGRDLGYVFYRDMCRGALPGVEASPVHWKIYQKVREMVATGRRPAQGSLKLEELYHPHILVMRGKASQGLKKVGRDEMQAMLDEVRSMSSGDDETARAAALELGMTLPEDEGESLVQLQAKARKGRRRAQKTAE